MMHLLMLKLYLGTHSGSGVALRFIRPSRLRLLFHERLFLQYLNLACGVRVSHERGWCEGAVPSAPSLLLCTLLASGPPQERDPHPQDLELRRVAFAR